MSYLIDQRRLIFLRKMYYSDNLVPKTLSSLKYKLFIAIGSKYDISAYDTPIKTAVWHTFEPTLHSISTWYLFRCFRCFLDCVYCFCNFRCIFYMCFLYFAASWRNKRLNDTWATSSDRHLVSSLYVFTIHSWLTTALRQSFNGLVRTARDRRHRMVHHHASSSLSHYSLLLFVGRQHAIPGEVISSVFKSNALQCRSDKLSFVRLNDSVSAVHNIYIFISPSSSKVKWNNKHCRQLSICKDYAFTWRRIWTYFFPDSFADVHPFVFSCLYFFLFLIRKDHRHRSRCKLRISTH